MMLDNEKVLVVGGSGDIGLALCRELLSKGASVQATWCTNPDGLQLLSKEYGDKLLLSQLDVRDSRACEAFGDELDSRGNIPGCFIYNAGVTEDVPILGMTDEQWDKVFDVNVKGALNVIRSVAKYMSLERRGKIFLVSSVAGRKGGRGQGNYAASKAALEALGRTLAVELARKDIMVNMIAPGVIESTMAEDVMARAKKEVLGNITLGRAGKPEEVARFVSHLCSPEITYITGQTFYIDGGFKL